MDHLNQKKSQILEKEGFIQSVVFDSCVQHTVDCRRRKNTNQVKDPLVPCLSLRFPAEMRPEFTYERHRLTIFVGHVQVDMHGYACVPNANTLYTTCLHKQGAAP